MMKGWDRVLLVLVLALLIVPAAAHAGEWKWSNDEDEDEDYNWKTWRTPRSHGGFDGFGGFFFNVQTFESDGLDDLAGDMDLEAFDGLIYTWGGMGMGHVGDGWRIGGGGYGGGIATDGVYTAGDGTPYNRSLEMSYGAGGFMFEYSPWMYGPVNFGVGSMIGGGGVSITLSQDTGTYTWKKLYGQYTDDPDSGDNIRTEIDQGFFVAEPYVTVRVHILDWMALHGTAGWTLTTLRAGEWSFNDNELTGNGPGLDLNRPFYRIGLVFGG